MDHNVVRSFRSNTTGKLTVQETRVLVAARETLNRWLKTEGFVGKDVETFHSSYKDGVSRFDEPAPSTRVRITPYTFLVKGDKVFRYQHHRLSYADAVKALEKL